jgi:hypothetical protein
LAFVVVASAAATGRRTSAFEVELPILASNFGIPVPLMPNFGSIRKLRCFYKLWRHNFTTISDSKFEVRHLFSFIIVIAVSLLIHLRLTGRIGILPRFSAFARAATCNQADGAAAEQVFDVCLARGAIVADQPPEPAAVLFVTFERLGNAAAGNP